MLEFMNSNNYSADVKMLGIPDRIVEHGTLKELHRRMRLRCTGNIRCGAYHNKRKHSILPSQDKMQAKYAYSNTGIVFLF